MEPNIEAILSKISYMVKGRKDRKMVILILVNGTMVHLMVRGKKLKKMAVFSLAYLMQVSDFKEN